MAKAGWLNLLDADPDTEWKKAGRKAADHTPKRRNKLIEGIERAIASLKSGDEKPRRGWYTTKGDRCRMTIKAGNKIIPVNGREYNTTSKANALDVYTGMLNHAKAGGFDADMNAVYDGAGGTAKRKSGGSRGGWSPARRAAFEAAKAKK